MLIQSQVLLRSSVFFGGNWVKADSGASIAVRDPASGLLLAEVPDCGASETQRAIAAADAALPAWRAQTAKQRAQMLQRWFVLINQNAEDLARMITAECGKPLTEARGEVAYGASFVEWFAEEGKRVYGETIPATLADKRLVVIKQAIGVCAALTPWNFPLAMITRKVAPALAAGCTVVVKPAEQTPLTALALAVLAEEAGFPAGVFNVLTGDPVAIGGELTANPIVRKLSFTGSTEVGRLLMAQCAPTIKKLSLELGGNAPFIVFDDADVDAAVNGALIAKYRNTGQTCVCANRVLVQSGVYEEFARKLAAGVAELKVGAGADEGVVQGPLIDDSGLAKVEAHVADALANGARVFHRAQAWIHEGHRYTAAVQMIANRIERVDTPALWVFTVDPGDDAGIFIRYTFPFFPKYKHRMVLGESRHISWERAVRFKRNVRKKLLAGELTIFVISGPRLLVFDAGNPGPEA